MISLGAFDHISRLNSLCCTITVPLFSSIFQSFETLTWIWTLILWCHFLLRFSQACGLSTAFSTLYKALITFYLFYGILRKSLKSNKLSEIPSGLFDSNFNLKFLHQFSTVFLFAYHFFLFHRLVIK